MWFKEMLSGAQGEVSSKRSILFILILLFIGLTIASQVTQKTFDETLKEQLFWLIQTTLVLVFGERALLAWQNVKGKVEKKETKIEITEKKDANTP